MTSPLLPCPFCGKPPRLGKRLPGGRTGHYTGCNVHTMFMPPEQWNFRAPAVPAAEVEALRELERRVACVAASMEGRTIDWIDDQRGEWCASDRVRAWRVEIESALTALAAARKAGA